MLLTYISKLLKSPASLYVILRYVTYALQFLNSILLVNVLGEYGYGIYGFILMFCVYAIYLNLGLNESLNAEYAINKNDKIITSTLWNNTLSFILIWYSLCTILALVIVHYSPNLFSKYQFKQYSIILILTCVLHNVSTIYATLYKIYGKTLKVNIQQLLPQLSILIIIFLGPRIASIVSVVIALFISNLLSLIICIVHCPERYSFSIDLNTIKLLIKRGISLLLYNLSFQMLTMLALAVVSMLYSVEQMGCYSLANSITNGVIMAGGAFLYIFSPRILNKMGESKIASVRLITKFEEVYNIFIDLVSVISILFVLALSYAYPSYGTSFVRIYAILIIARIINNAATGYSTYLIAYKSESKLVICGFLSLLISGVCYWIIEKLKYSIYNIPLTIVISSIIFSCMVIMIGQYKLHGRIQIKEMIRLLFGQNKWIIILMAVIYAYYYSKILIIIGGFMLYILFNLKNIITSTKVGYRIVCDKYALNF